MRRKYARLTDTRGNSSCWTAPENSQLYGRFWKPNAQAGSYLNEMTGLPNARFVLGPSSPLTAGLSGSPCTTRSLFESVHVRVIELLLRIGLMVLARPVPSPCT